MSAKVKSAVRFCNKLLSFSQSDIDAKLRKVKSDDLARVKRYYVMCDKRKVNVSDVMRYVANVPLVWHVGKTGNLVGTYSTAQAMRTLLKLKVKVYDAYTEKPIKLVDDKAK